jgi:putative endonuclease
MEKQWYVYILECHDESLYTGITNDLEKRMAAHESGHGSKYVKRKGFLQLLHAIKAKDKSEASKLEYKIKQLPRNDKITFFMKHKDKAF